MKTSELAHFLPALGRSREPDLKFLHKFLGYGIHKSACQVEIWKDSKHALVMLTDINVGTSVTNAAEQLVEEIYVSFLDKGFARENVLFVERYEGRSDVDIICPDWNGTKVRRVGWKRLGDIISE